MQQLMVWRCPQTKLCDCRRSLHCVLSRVLWAWQNIWQNIRQNIWQNIWQIIQQKPVAKPYVQSADQGPLMQAGGAAGAGAGTWGMLGKSGPGIWNG